MKIPRATAILLLATLLLSLHAAEKPAALPPIAWPVERHDVTWDSPSANAKGSMPIGNGDIGANVWVESNGDLLVLIGKSDSFDEFNRLLKLGRIRIKTTPALFQPGQTFTQTLRLEDGAIEIATATAKLRVWVDANHPVVQVDVTSPSPVAAQVLLENWRREARALTTAKTGGATMTETASAYGNFPDKLRVTADTFLPAKPGQLAWCHHNAESQWQKNLEHTALGDEIAKGRDPILNRSFGALIRAKGFTAVSNTELKSTAPAKSFSVRIVPLTTFADSAEAWLTLAEKSAGSVPASAAARFSAHQAWWQGFWRRSWIEVSSPKQTTTATYQGKLRLGVDTKGGNAFLGTIDVPVSFSRSLTADEIAALAKAPHGETSVKEVPDISLAGDLTVAAWIKPSANEHGRIFDKSTPATADGLLFDTEPGNSLRFNFAGSLIQHNQCLKPDVWQHVAATFNAKSGEQRLYLDGVLLESKKFGMPDPAAQVNRAYALQRYVTACAGRGNLPVKFNGSLFTVEGPDPDYRSWGGCYWWQNTREAYWAMLYAGDYAMMEPLFRMYRESLPLRMAATRKYYGHEGAFYPETMYFWGNYNNENYGFERKGKPDGLTDNTYIRRYWQSGIELVAMLLDTHDGTGDVKLRDETLLPIAKQITLFFDQHWQRDATGKIRFDPAQSLETWHTAVNPLPEIAGLRYVLPRLLALPADEATKAHWKKLLADLPPTPVAKDKEGRERIMPAETFGNKSNSENPELYGVFPYRTYTAMTGGRELELGLNAWKVRRHPEDRGWQQNVIQAPLLGLANEAKAMVAARAARTAGGYRFPGFFGPNYDWTPEQCHATNLMTGLQRMLMQCEGDRIVLLPAWPKGWNASFKLHAPNKTTVSARVENGELKELVVVPESRRKDVEIRSAQ
jgi:hypothetical protein